MQRSLSGEAEFRQKACKQGEPLRTACLIGVGGVLRQQLHCRSAVWDHAQRTAVLQLYCVNCLGNLTIRCMDLLL